MKKTLILTCSLCANFEPNAGICKLNGEKRKAYTSKYAKTCYTKGKFVRYMYILPDSFNHFDLNEEIPTNWDHDKSKLPTDDEGVPLWVKTNRGIERAIPANDSVLLKGDLQLGVPRILTYQGQREAIFELGVEEARKEADELGVDLTALPEESEGAFDNQEQRGVIKRNTPWLKENLGEDW
ncbi:hypothetical protein J2S74_002977 [Evansella vedderi]|uniref:Uncharacterized protein n=1 Tax=Evansella vedderi TaxID=38282 RepID=A0ABT9ZZT2_9BACI|nr:hypothetical protein [Evansella vedderi]MDQ0255595.1 hypothetical protein [Evansella vedderi]